MARPVVDCRPRLSENEEPLVSQDHGDVGLMFMK